MLRMPTPQSKPFPWPQQRHMHLEEISPRPRREYLSELRCSTVCHFLLYLDEPSNPKPVISIFMITLLVPSDDPMLLRSTGTAAQSPFLIAAERAGIRVVPHIINAIVLSSAWSSGNSSETPFLHVSFKTSII